MEKTPRVEDDVRALIDRLNAAFSPSEVAQAVHGAGSAADDLTKGLQNLESRYSEPEVTDALHRIMGEREAA